MEITLCKDSYLLDQCAELMHSSEPWQMLGFDLQRWLYTRLGYEQVGVFKDHLARGYDEYLLRKSAGPFSEFIPGDE